MDLERVCASITNDKTISWSGSIAINDLRAGLNDLGHGENTITIAQFFLSCPT